jgi:peptidase E
VDLIGGGPGAILQTRRHLHAAVKAIGKARPVIAYVGAASNDHPGFRAMISAAFVGTGAKVQPAEFSSTKTKAAAARRLIDDCDLVFVSGGDVDHGMTVLGDAGAVEQIRSLAAAGKPMLGISAGSIMLCRQWVRFPDEDDESSAELFDCLGVVPLHVDTHSEDDDWSELRVLLRLLGKQGPKPTAYGIPSKGRLEIEASGDEIASMKAFGDAVPRFLFAGGKVVADQPVAKSR